MFKTDTKTLVLGIDGLSLSLARNLSARGTFKNLACIVNAPEAMAINSELPDVSPVNWVSFFTGRGPEKHGIYGFTGLDSVDYNLFLTNFSHVRAQTVWDQLGSKGLSSRIINLPCTYPAPKLRGMLISGFVAPDLNRAVYPRAILPMLQRTGYILEADTSKGLSRPDLLIHELKQTTASRVRAFDLFWPDLAWELFIMVFTELDRLSHFLLDAVLDKRHLFHQDCMELLEELDSAAGHILERFDELPGPKRLLVVADHGFTPLKQEVDLNTFLRIQGFLTLNRKPGNELDLSCMDTSSRSFALDHGRIYIHDRERFSRGRVSPWEYAGIREKICSSLIELKYRGKRVISRVYPGEEIYPSGVGLVPDLLCLPADGFDLKAKFDRPAVFGHFGRTGTHSPDDVFFYDSKAGKPQRVRDILPGTGIMDLA